MNKSGNDSITFGALVLGLVAILGLLWLLKIILGIFLAVAESIVIFGIYAVIFYFVITVIFTIYDHVVKGRSPSLVKAVLKFHHSAAGFLQSIYSAFKKKQS